MHKVPHVQLYNSMFTISFTLVQVPCLKLYNLQKQFHVYRYNPQLHFTCNCRVQRYSPQVWLYNLQVQFHKCNSTAYVYNSTVYMYSSMCATLQPTCATLQLQFHEYNPTAYVYNSTVYMYSSTCETLQSTCTTNKYISTCTVYKYTSTCKVYKCISIKRQLKKKKKKWVLADLPNIILKISMAVLTSDSISGIQGWRKNTQNLYYLCSSLVRSKE